jgi:hypothetical protein
VDTSRAIEKLNPGIDAKNQRPERYSKLVGVPITSLVRVYTAAPKPVMVAKAAAKLV